MLPLLYDIAYSDFMTQPLHMTFIRFTIEFKDQKQTGHKWFQHQKYDVSYSLLNNSIMKTIDVN